MRHSFTCADNGSSNKATNWAGSANGDNHVLHVKDKGWKAYEYKTDKQWVVMGDYNYTQRELKAVDGF